MLRKAFGLDAGSVVGVLVEEEIGIMLENPHITPDEIVEKVRLRLDDCIRRAEEMDSLRKKRKI